MNEGEQMFLKELRLTRMENWDQWNFVLFHMNVDVNEVL